MPQCLQALGGAQDRRPAHAEKTQAQLVMPALHGLGFDFTPIGIAGGGPPTILAVRIYPVAEVCAADALMADVGDAGWAARDQRIAHDPIGSDGQRRGVDEKAKADHVADVELDQIRVPGQSGQRHRTFHRIALLLLQFPVALRSRDVLRPARAVVRVLRRGRTGRGQQQQEQGSQAAPSLRSARRSPTSERCISGATVTLAW